MRASRRALLRDAACGGSSGQVALLSMRYFTDGIKKTLIRRKPPLRDAASRRLLRMGGCLERRTALIKPIDNSFAVSQTFFDKSWTLPDFEVVN